MHGIIFGELKMCGVAIGIVRGIAQHYCENVQIRELACMAAGASECRILVRALGPSS